MRLAPGGDATPDGSKDTIDRVAWKGRVVPGGLPRCASILSKRRWKTCGCSTNTWLANQTSLDNGVVASWWNDHQLKEVVRLNKLRRNNVFKHEGNSS